MYNCGPEKWKTFFRPPYTVFFDASCALHDEGYKKGGTEMRRFECDLKFYSAMVADCDKLNKDRIKYLLWATLYFLSVRLFGFKFFNYNDNGYKGYVNMGEGTSGVQYTSADGLVPDKTTDTTDSKKHTRWFFGRYKSRRKARKTRPKKHRPCKRTSRKTRGKNG